MHNIFENPNMVRNNFINNTFAQKNKGVKNFPLHLKAQQLNSNKF